MSVSRRAGTLTPIRVSKWLGTLIAPALLLLAATSLQAGERGVEPDARAWLERMNRAIRELDYEGYFVYGHDNVLDAMHIVHVVRNGREHERLVSLNGAAREVVRDDKVVTCLLPSRGHIKVSRRPIGRSMSPLMPIEAEALMQNYRFSLGPDRRVAGRQSVTVDIRPKDGLRYGYLLSLDREHALPLRSIMQDTDGRVLSQILFTNLRTGPDVAASAPTNLPDEITERERRVERSAVDSLRMGQPCCEFTDLPPGFDLSMYRHRAIDGGLKAEHFVFTDGLASISVYVEPREAGNGVLGSRQMGAVQVLGLTVDPYHVTIVGEVPPETLRQFAERITIASR